MDEKVLLQPARKKTFIKVSGDEYLNPAFRTWIKQLSKESWVVICVGGGTQINEEFARRGFPVKPHGPLGRETDTFEERQVQRDVLEMNQTALQDWLAKEGVFAAVEIPFVMSGTVHCPVNGDQMLRTVYLGFDELFVVTTPERVESKQDMFAELPKIKIKAFARA